MAGNKRPSSVLEALEEAETASNDDPEVQGVAEHGDDSDGDQRRQLPPPKKRRGPGKKNRMHIWYICSLYPYWLFPGELIDDSDGPGTQAKAAASISYTLSLFTLSQMKKDSKKRGNPKTAVMQLKSDLEWDTFKAKVLVKNWERLETRYSVIWWLPGYILDRAPASQADRAHEWRHIPIHDQPCYAKQGSSCDDCRWDSCPCYGK